MKKFIGDESVIARVVEAIEACAHEHLVVLLHGDLAAGKTTLVQAFAKAQGLSQAVTSPTYSLQHCYGDSLFHYDLYNKGSEHFFSLGLFEVLEQPGIHFIEWADEKLRTFIAQAQMPMVSITIIKHENQREYEVDDAYATC